MKARAIDLTTVVCQLSEPDDAATIVTWFRERKEVVTWAGEATPNPLTAEWLIGELSLPDKVHCTLTNGTGLIVGFFTLILFPSEGRAHLTRVAVSPDLQGQGVGRLIVGQSIGVARDNGARVLSLSVYTSNQRAFEIYERAGFIESNPQPTPQDIRDPLVRMEFAL